MALERLLNANRAKQTRRDANGADKEGSGGDRHMLAGPTGSGTAQRRYRSLVQVAWDWTDVKRLVKAELLLRVEDDSTHFTLGSKPRISVQRATSTWSDGSGGENVWSAAAYQAVTSATGGVAASLAINPTTGLPQDEAWLAVDITNLIKPVVPTGVLMPDGSTGGGGANHGFLVRTVDEASAAQRAIFYSKESATPANRPYVRLVYDPLPLKPTAPTLLGPATTNNTFADSFEGQHNDPDGSPMTGRIIEVYLVGGSVNQWPMPAALQNAGSDETASGRFSVPLSLATGSLKLQTAYEWVAKTRDADGLWGPFSTRRALRITSSGPTIVATPYLETASMAGVMFGGTYSDPEGNPVNLFHLQMRRLSAHNDAAFADTNELVWDTGETIPTATEAGSRVIARDYGGSPLAAGDFTYRIRARDATGVWSAWAYDDFKLTAGFDPDPGSTDLTTQIARSAPIRVALYAMGALRGRGALIGYVDDPIELGASAYMNSGGEMFFSLPALHPYVPSIEPHRVHYSVEQYYGDRYREMPGFQGIITDFDADADNIVFYGTDYPGLLQTAVDERYDPARAEQAANGTGGAGSKYTDKAIDYIVRDQLLYHKNLANSPVGFIAVGTLTALAERVTIYSTYAECLPFLSGLIDSHKQGTGREARLYVKPSADYTTWAWTLTDNWGKDRPNIRLEYGGLLNDFRVVALGDFGTRVLGVGQKRGEVKVYRATGKPVLDEALWGRRSKTRFYQDIIDQNDLQRRVDEDTALLSKVGKRMALAIRADMLQPFDGWDIGDSIKVDVVRGAVDTNQYGSSGYWTIRGVEWHYYPDGHTDMTLTVLPKKSLTAPNPDLIPSVNPGISKEWQVGYGVPTTYGEPPINTPVLREGKAEGDEITALTLPLSTDPVNAKFYEDLNTGCVYELDETTGVYAETYCPPTDGGGTPYVPDIVPPAVPAVLSATSGTVPNADGAMATNILASVGYSTPPVDLDDLDSYMLESTRFPRDDDPALPDWTRATIWFSQSEDLTGVLPTPIVQPNVLAAEKYWLRVYAIDKSGNRSPPSADVIHTTSEDPSAPPPPTGIVAEAGMSTIGLRWDPVEVSDFAYVEVGWRLSPAGSWTSVRVAGTLVVITGLTNDLAYDVRLRSVDTSGNTVLDATATPPVTVKATDPDAGWVSGGTLTPTALPGDALVWDEAMFGELFSGYISADMITAGTLKVGGAPDSAAAIEVYDADGELVGRWTEAGIEVMDPANPKYKLTIAESSLHILDVTDPANPVALVTMNPLGIDASSITFGSARGGHNLIQNSSFELGAFAATNVTSSTWDLAADWNAAGSRQGADENVTTGASALTMTTVV